MWASANGVDSRVADFISDSPTWLDGDGVNGAKADTGLEKTPDRRAWCKVSDIIMGREDIAPLKKVLSGIVGVAAAAKFITFSSENSLVSGKDVLLNLRDVMAKLMNYKVHQLAQVNESIFRYVEVTDMSDQERAVAGPNLSEYVATLENSGNKEVMAHFASIFTKGLYPKSVAFIMSDAPTVFNAMLSYVQNL